MNKDSVLKFVGIFIVAFMALSMIAVAFLYAGDNSGNGNTNQNPNVPTLDTTAFSYNASFDSVVLKELKSGRFTAFTSSLDKAAIDAAVLKVDGVSKINTQFRKSATDSNEWVYFADITYKTNANIASTINSIFDLNFFNQARRSEFVSVKYVTVKAPPFTIIKNTDLNIDKNFSFPSSTLSILAGVETIAGNEINVGGKVSLKGNDISSIELFEYQNLTLAREYEEALQKLQIDSNSDAVAKRLADLNIHLPFDTNSPVDLNKNSTDFNQGSDLNSNN